MNEVEKPFALRSYSWQELALLYNPCVSPGTASKRLSDWVRKMPGLETELQTKGWQKRSRLLTPLQVEILIHYLGEP